MPPAFAAGWHRSCWRAALLRPDYNYIDRPGPRIEHDLGLATLELPGDLRDLLIEGEVALAVLRSFTKHKGFQHTAQRFFRELRVLYYHWLRCSTVESARLMTFHQPSFQARGSILRSCRAAEIQAPNQPSTMPAPSTIRISLTVGPCSEYRLPLSC